MTPRELAEKIWGQTHLILDRDQFIEVVESILSSALEEAKSEGCSIAKQKWIDVDKEIWIKEAKAAAFEEGFAAGKDSATPIHCCVSDNCDLLPEKIKESYEECAKIAEVKHIEWCNNGYGDSYVCGCNDIAKQIRQLKDKV